MKIPTSVWCLAAVTTTTVTTTTTMLALSTVSTCCRMVSAFVVSPHHHSPSSSSSSTHNSLTTSTGTTTSRLGNKQWDRRSIRLADTTTIISPFDDSNTHDENSAAAVATVEQFQEEGPLDLTWENVEMVLDEMRPYLIQDGGNVKIQEIDGPVVKLQLEVRKSIATK